MDSDIAASAHVSATSVGASEVREFVTLRDSRIGDDCKIYERTSIKRCDIGDAVDVNAGSYLENAAIESNVQIAPNSNVVGVTHDLSERGMEFRNDSFEEVVLREGAFLGAGTVVGPGVEIGARSVVAAGATVTEDVDPGMIVLGSPPTQRVVDLEDWTRR